MLSVIPTTELLDQQLHEHNSNLHMGQKLLKKQRWITIIFQENENHSLMKKFKQATVYLFIELIWAEAPTASSQLEFQEWPG